jgi:integrase
VTPGLLSALKAEFLKTPIGNAKTPKNGRPKLLAGSSVNNIFNFMRSAVNRAIATGMWSGANPLSTKGGVWRMVKVNNARLRFFTREEAKALLEDLAATHPQLHDMALLSLRTGLRCTEIFKLKGQDVDANAGVLHVIAKGGRRTPVRVPADMLAMLQSYNRKPGEPIFQTPVTGEAFTKTPAAFRFAVKRLALTPEDGKPSGGKRPVPLPWRRGWPCSGRCMLCRPHPRIHGRTPVSRSRCGRKDTAGKLWLRLFCLAGKKVLPAKIETGNVTRNGWRPMPSVWPGM